MSANSKRSSKCVLFSVSYILVAVMVIVAVMFILRTSGTSNKSDSASKLPLESAGIKQLHTIVYDPDFGHLPSLSLSATDSTTVTVRLEKDTKISSSTSDVFVSVLTTPVLHGKRFSYQLMTWIPTFIPSQVRVLTDSSSDRWIRAAQEIGVNTVFSGCHSSYWHDRNNLCCKTGRQYEEYYKARKNGETYGWYCHVDDDMYLNAETLGRLLSKYGDPNTQNIYLGQWKNLGKYFRTPRIPDGELITLKNFPEAKKQGVKYAQGSTFCISDAIMKTAEKYLSGKNFEKTCEKLSSKMDDMASGAVIESILGNELTETSEFASDIKYNRMNRLSEKQLKEMVSVPMVLPQINNPRFDSKQDPTRLLSFHCMIRPNTSWCRTK